MSSKLSILGAIASLSLLCSCGSIVNGTTQPVCITSKPVNANVFVDQKFVGQTPVKTKVSRRERHVVRLEAEGYEPFEITLDRRMSKWVFGNLVSFGIPGLAVDAISGGLYKIDPNAFHANLSQSGITETEPSTVG